MRNVVVAGVVTRFGEHLDRSLQSFAEQALGAALIDGRGHALGATGLAQIAELVVQLRGEAGERQVVDPIRALPVNAGGWMGSDYAATVVTALAGSDG